MGINVFAISLLFAGSHELSAQTMSRPAPTAQDGGLPPVLFGNHTVDPGDSPVFRSDGHGWTAGEPATEVDQWSDQEPWETPPGSGDVSELDSTAWTWHVLPRGIVYRSYLAAAKESRLGTQLVHERDDNTLFDSTLGGRFGVLRFGPEAFPEGFQWDIDGAAMVRLDPDEKMDVQATDYRVGSTVSFGIGRHRWRAGYYHVSSHLGDEFLLKHPTYHRLNFHRDALLAGYSYYFNPDFRVYGELAVAFYYEDAKPVEFIFGFDWAPGGPTGPRGAPFAAFNTHLRQELDFGGNIALQAGWAWRGTSPASGLLRTGLYYYNGGSPQWSFYQDFEEQLGIGLWYDF